MLKVGMLIVMLIYLSELRILGLKLLNLWLKSIGLPNPIEWCEKPPPQTLKMQPM